MLIAKRTSGEVAHYRPGEEVTQEVAVNEMVEEALNRAEEDPATEKRLDRAKDLQAALDAL